jgi:hypothetical protein
VAGTTGPGKQTIPYCLFTHNEFANRSVVCFPEWLDVDVLNADQFYESSGKHSALSP